MWPRHLRLQGSVHFKSQWRERSPGKTRLFIGKRVFQLPLHHLQAGTGSSRLAGWTGRVLTALPVPLATRGQSLNRAPGPLPQRIPSQPKGPRLSPVAQGTQLKPNASLACGKQSSCSKLLPASRASSWAVPHMVLEEKGCQVPLVQTGVSYNRYRQVSMPGPGAPKPAEGTCHS